MKKRLVIFVLPIITGALASITGYDLIWRLFFLSLLIPLASYLWIWINISGIRGKSDKIRPKIRAGEILESNLQLINSNKIPKLFLKVQEDSDFPGYSNINLINLSSSGTIDLPSRLECLYRGKYFLGAYSVTAKDPLGIFSRSIKVGEPQQVLVFPRTVDLPFFDPINFANQGYGQNRWFASQISPNVATIRDYANGDSLKHIHWRTTAHSSKLMVKVYDPDQSSNTAKNIWLVLDMNSESQAGYGIESTEEYSITIAASIAKKYIDNGWPVGLITTSEKPHIFPLESGYGHLESIDAALASLKPNGKEPIERLIAAESYRFDLNALTIIITPAWNERLVSILLQIKRQQGLVAVIILDSASFGSPAGMTGIPGSLIQNGIQVYTVKKGDNLVKVLDSRDL